MTDARKLPLSPEEVLPEESVFDVTLLDPVVLQRGGEELTLGKVNDRFVVCPAAGCSVAAVLAAIQAPDVRPSSILPNLLEIQVTPSDLDDLMQQARSAAAIAFASHVYQMYESPGTLLYPTDQITLQFAESLAAEQMHRIVAAAGLRILKLIAGVPKAFVFQVTASAPANPLKLANQLLQHPAILLAEPNVAVLRQPCYRPRESNYAQQWYLNHEGGADLVPGSHIFAEPAWNLTKGKRSITVAVADDGFDLEHPDLQSEGKIVAAVELQRGGIPLAKTSETHGTACARLITADETGKGMIGVAPGCALMPIGVGAFIEDQTIEQLCQWTIENGADVVCCGWSAAATYFPLSLRQRVALTQAATQGRDGRGCVLVFPAGNANRPLSGMVSEQDWPNQLLQGATRWLNGFAVHPDVITVAACTSLNHKSACSNWGPGISVAAPGGHAPPMYYAQQTGLVPTGPVCPPQLGRAIVLDEPTAATTTADAVHPALLGDTSAACAIVAGVAALVLSIHPDLTALQVRQILEQTADKILDPEPDAQLKLQLGHYDANRYSAAFGYGKVNAVKALQFAQQQITPLPLPQRWIQYSNSTPLDIPDGNPEGISSIIQITEAGSVQDIEVRIDIEHEFMGDLEVYLIPPWGTKVLLQSRAIGRLTSLKTTYSLETTLWLKTVLNHPVQGKWRLHIIDWVPENKGQLRNWQLDLGV
ncbi:MAG: S8 family serine peptidase [Leptolyngbya sp. IPPAS B-1204]|nr:MAG: peptidase S8 [Leptolyngbya sp. IPPAS B-1204]